MCYYFDDIIRFEDFEFDDTLLDKNDLKLLLIYDVSYKTSIGTKPLCIVFDKLDGFIRDYEGTKYLVLFSPEKYVIYDRIRHLIELKNGIIYLFSYSYGKIKINLDADLPPEKCLLCIMS